jgi:dimethylargininase
VRLTHAIVRPPAETYAQGITTSDLGPPDLELALKQHEDYCRALESLGLSLERLPPDPAFPDSCFVEDTTIVTSRGAILTRPGAPSRAGEVAAMEPVLRRYFSELDCITAPGTLDGGDVCEAGDQFFIGVSQRTNKEGATQLATWLARRGFEASLVDIQGIPGLLHLKTGLSWVGRRRLLVWREIAGHQAFRGWDLIETPSSEEYAANVIQVNDAVVIPQGFPATATWLRAAGDEVQTVEMSEYRKMDGGLSCLSVRW